MTIAMPEVIEHVTDRQCAHAVVPAADTLDYRRRSDPVVEHNRDPKLCLRTVSHLVDGRGYCSMHAGYVLLAMAVRQHRKSLSDRLREVSETVLSPDVAQIMNHAADALDARRPQPEQSV